MGHAGGAAALNGGGPPFADPASQAPGASGAGKKGDDAYNTMK